jgi:hypothetical protein
MNQKLAKFAGIFIVSFSLTPIVLGWDYEGHRLINQLALASLPTNFPNFVKSASARERIAFLAGEPDRWRNAPDLTLRHCNALDHYMDIDELPYYQLEPATLSPLRYEFVAHLARVRASRPKDFMPLDPAKDADRTKQLVGFLPWTISEYYGKLKSSFSYLKALEEAGTTEEIANAQQNVIYLMGLMGHFVGDGSQPLHTTKHFNGWLGENPHRYTTNRTFHAWIDGGYFARVKLKSEPLFAKVRPARLLTSPVAGVHTNIFPLVMNYLNEQFKLVEPLYRLDRDYKLPGREGIDAEGYEFMTGQLLIGAQMLGDLWLTAWNYAPPDTFLKTQLAKRKLTNERTADDSSPANDKSKP